MFDVCGLWLVKHLLGEIELPDKATMNRDWNKWVDRNKTLANCHEEIDFRPISSWTWPRTVKMTSLTIWMLETSSMLGSITRMRTS